MTATTGGGSAGFGTVDMADILSPACVGWGAAAASRKRVLDMAADTLAAAHGQLDARGLFNALMARELLGSTGLGEGVAIPHCRLDCPRLVGGLFTLAEPVDFQVEDGRPVDLLFVLVAPAHEREAHLQVLADVAAVFNDGGQRACLRAAASPGELRARFLAAHRSRASLRAPA